MKSLIIDRNYWLLGEEVIYLGPQENPLFGFFRSKANQDTLFGEKLSLVRLHRPTLTRTRLKSDTGWGIVYHQTLQLASVRKTRKEATDAFQLHARMSWRIIKNCGYRCVKVRAEYNVQTP